MIFDFPQPLRTRWQVLTLAWLACVPLPAQQLQPIPLPPPLTEIGKPLMQALKARQSIREFDGRKLSPQELSNLLWAAFGINRPETGGRTAPSAMNSQEIDLYVATADGLYLYQAKAHLLKPVRAGDIRSAIGGQAHVKAAGLNLIFVADFARMTKAKPADKGFYAGIDTGVISQNVYLYCASEGLATVVYALGKKEELAKAMQLGPEQKPMLAQAVGYPK